jgi:cytidine deaminase
MEHTTNILNIEIYSFDELPNEFKQLVDEAKHQTKKAYAPYSHFQVGSAVLLENGIVIGGNNQENSAYPSGMCAERIAVFYANSQYPGVPIRAIAIAAFHNGDFTKEPVNPCGACLQVMLESEKRQNKDIKLILFGKDNIHLINGIKEILPFSFKF